MLFLATQLFTKITNLTIDISYLYYKTYLLCIIKRVFVQFFKIVSQKLLFLVCNTSFKVKKSMFIISSVSQSIYSNSSDDSVARELGVDFSEFLWLFCVLSPKQYHLWQPLDIETQLMAFHHLLWVWLAKATRTCGYIYRDVKCQIQGIRWNIW